MSVFVCMCAVCMTSRQTEKCLKVRERTLNLQSLSHEAAHTHMPTSHLNNPARSMYRTEAGYRGRRRGSGFRTCATFAIWVNIFSPGRTETGPWTHWDPEGGLVCSRQPFSGPAEEREKTGQWQGTRIPPQPPDFHLFCSITLILCSNVILPSISILSFCVSPGKRRIIWDRDRK